MELPLVVGVDGSESSLQAVDWAVDEAARLGLPLRLVHASLWERYEGVDLVYDLGRPSEQQMAETIVRTAAERARLRNPDVKVSAYVLAEDPEGALLREARNASALVTGQRGRGQVADLLLGSVSLTTAAQAHCPVVVVRGSQDSRNGTHGRIVLGVGDAATGAAAIGFAFREAQTRGCALDAVRAWRCPAHETADRPLLAGEPAHYHQQQATELLGDALRTVVREYPDVEVHRTIVEGPARKVLLDRAGDADLLVIGARRRHGQFGLQLGRVGHAVLHHADCPVAIVPQHG
ncbi:nucleotide-binding universal stress UspA family protein [Streptomyces sp. B4I13]|uniref:universal stress protein n=1 Tax=Streptomyces sp. B4I13 TaxID=3042271 RepID=UPI0027857B6F|nr:universal stress protein [Streptomyces sp. B4I13]MDQ0958137.1 nucleotide-binding universal stress UspA family protein [Streptomyces sp. B4I13]